MQVCPAKVLAPRLGSVRGPGPCTWYHRSVSAAEWGGLSFCTWEAVSSARLLARHYCLLVLQQPGTAETLHTPAPRDLRHWAAVCPCDSRVAQQWSSAGQNDDPMLTVTAGHLASQTSLGFLYEQGLGVPQDLPAAAKW